MAAKVDELVGQFVYSHDDEELVEVVVRLLREKGLTVASAESCTGGLFAAAITDVAGASNVLHSAYVTYSAESKTANVGVPANMIEEYGVVSPQVAEAMAEGVRKAAGSDIGISITGFAGPESDPGHQAGEAYIGYSFRDQTGHYAVFTSRNMRKWNRNYFKLRMLRAVFELIK